MITPVSAVADQIRMRTEEYLKKLGTAVNAKPIVMRAEYAFCPNLTIIDTPGFILKVNKAILNHRDRLFRKIRNLIFGRISMSEELYHRFRATLLAMCLCTLRNHVNLRFVRFETCNAG